MRATGTNTTKASGRKSRAVGEVLRLEIRLSQAAMASTQLKYASDPVRLSILLTLHERERSLRELGAAIAQNPLAFSHHLALLRHGDLVNPRRQGKQSVYSLTDRGRWMTDLVRTLLRDEQSDDGKASKAAPIDPTLLEDVAGFVDDPESWFRMPNAEFEWRRPIELLGTPDETRLRDRIEAAKLGMFS